MADKNIIETVEVKSEGLEKAQGFIEKYGKKIGTAAVALLVVVGGYFGYQEFMVKPKAEEANDKIFKAQQYFAIDSFKLAVDGDGVNKGFKYIAENYSGTSIGKLAKYYAGVSYLRLGNYADAVKYLKDFSSDVPQVQMMAYGALADAQSELKNTDEAIANYKKAANTFAKDEGNSSEFLFKAALLSEVSGKTEDAATLYKELKEKFPKTDKGFQADKYINRISVEKPSF